MQTAAESDLMSVEDYLAAEEFSEDRHEYAGGLTFAMEHETRAHNTITGNFCYEIRPYLKKVSAQAFTINVPINFQHNEQDCFYYPDVVVTCDKRDTHPRFIRFPKLIIEVLSESTERTDKREKFFAYTNISTLEEYVLVAQGAKEVTIFRRSNNWKAEKFSGAKIKVPLRSLKLSLSLSAIYEGV